ncbi:MAG: PEP-CTERM sorting domain-containing protein [Phycisphaerae bacterium]
MHSRTTTGLFASTFALGLLSSAASGAIIDLKNSGPFQNNVTSSTQTVNSSTSDELTLTITALSTSATDPTFPRLGTLNDGMGVRSTSTDSSQLSWSRGEGLQFSSFSTNDSNDPIRINSISMSFFSTGSSNFESFEVLVFDGDATTLFETVEGNVIAGTVYTPALANPLILNVGDTMTLRSIQGGSADNDAFVFASIDYTVVPEPASLGLLGGGLMLLARRNRRESSR